MLSPEGLAKPTDAVWVSNVVPWEVSHTPRGTAGLVYCPVRG